MVKYTKVAAYLFCFLLYSPGISNAQLDLGMGICLMDSLPTGGEIVPYDIIQDGQNNFYIYGTLNGSIDLDTVVGMHRICGRGGIGDIALVKYDSTGVALWWVAIGGANDEAPGGILLDAAGDIIVTGTFSGYCDFDGSDTATYFLDAGNNSDIFMAKYTPTGDLVWAKRYGGYGVDRCIDAIGLSNGGFLALGTFHDSADFNPGPGINILYPHPGGDVFFGEFDSQGYPVWVKSFGGNQLISPSVIRMDASSNILIVGNFYGTVDFDPGSGVASMYPYGSGDGFIASYNFTGNYQWSRTVGGPGVDDIYTLEFDTTGLNFFFGGSFQNTVDFNWNSGLYNLQSNGGSDGFIAYYTWQGNFISAFALGGISSENVLSLDVFSNNEVVVCGYFGDVVDFAPGPLTDNRTSNGYADIFLGRYTSTGNQVWTKTMGSLNWDQGNAVLAGSTGQIIMGAIFRDSIDVDPGAGVYSMDCSSSSGTLCAFSPTGNFDWANQLGWSNWTSTGIQSGTSVVADQLGNIFVGAMLQKTVDFDPGPSFACLTSLGGVDAALAKYSPTGALLWAKRFGGSLTGIFVVGLAVDSLGNLVVAGYFNNTSDMNPDPAIVLDHTSAGGRDFFIMKVDSNGNLIWVKSIGGLGDEYLEQIQLDSHDHIIVTGSFQNTVDFDPSSMVQARTSAGNSDCFVAKYDASGNLIWIKDFGGSGFDTPYDAAIDQFDNVITVGNYSGNVDFDPSSGTSVLSTIGQGQDMYIQKLDPMGGFIFAKTVDVISSGLSDDAMSVALTDGGGIVIAGGFQGSVDFDPSPSVFVLTSSGMRDFYTACYNPDGGFRWASSGGGVNFDMARDVTVDNLGHVIVAGIYRDTVDFDQSNGITKLFAQDNFDAFLQGFDTTGNFIYAYTMGGYLQDNLNCIYDSPNNKLYLTGSISYLVDLDVTSSVLEVMPLNYQDIFISMYNLSPCSIPSISTVSPGNMYVCPGDSVALSIQSGSLGNASNWYWYSGGCGVQLIDSGAVIHVAPMMTTTFYVRGEGGCVFPSSCSSILVTIDTLPPIPAVSSLPSLYASCDTVITAIPTAWDACSGLVQAITTDTLVYNQQGTYQISWQFVDIAGNTSLQTQSVVISDTIGPLPIMTSLPTISGTCSVSVTSYPMAIDNCSGLVLGSTGDSLTYDNIGAYNISWAFDDGNGNISYQNQLVVVSDSVAPIPIQSNLSPAVNPCWVVVDTVPLAIDNCGDTIWAVTNDPLFYNQEGTFQINWIYSDVGGNVTNQVQQIIVQPCVGILTDDNNMLISLFPNPTTDIFWIMSNADLEDFWTGRLINTMGCYVDYLEIVHFPFSVSMGDFPPGIYWLELKRKEVVKYYKIVKISP